MARNIAVTPEMLNSAANRIQTLAGEYKVQYEKLYSETGTLAATWNGRDHKAYIDQIAGFKDDFDRMYSLMVSYSEFLAKSAKAYSGVQNAVTSDANKLPTDSGSAAASAGGGSHGGGGRSW